MKKIILLVAIMLWSGWMINAANAISDETKQNNIEFRQAVGVKDEEHSIMISIQEQEYLVDTTVKTATASPYVLDGRTYIPVSTLEDILGVSITWDTREHSGLFMWRGSAFRFSLPENKIYYEGKEVAELSVDISEKKGIALPLVEVLNALTISYQWDGETSSVFMYGMQKDVTVKPDTTHLVSQEDFLKSYQTYLVENVKKIQAEEEARAKAENLDLVELAKSRLGMPYVMGAAGPYAFDCSGYIHWLYTSTGKAQYQRGSAQSLYSLCKPISKEELRVGDLLFYTRTYASRNKITHVSMYIGDGKVIHAAGNRVQITPMTDGYWTRHFYSYGRMN